MFLLEGVIASIVTPLRNGGSNVDPEGMRRYCDFIVEKGVHGIFAFGTTGEGPLLSVSERKLMAETVVTRISSRIPVIIQTGAITTENTIELTKHCCDIKADAAGVLLPFYYNLDDEAIFDHFKRITDAVPGFPLFLYNIPQSTGNNLSPELFQKLVDQIESIKGLKTSSADFFEFQDYLMVAKDKCSVFVGCDELTLPAFSIGASGVVSGDASVFPEPFVDLYRSFKRGELEKALEYHFLSYRLAKLMTGGPSIASFKKALELRGMNVGSVRRPNRELSATEVAELMESLREMNLIE
jgi:dihydrodipicolinate synthase/N-acetylneuraminate lyase